MLVTLKIRAGWDQASKNGIAIAKMAKDLGIQALAVHGRTHADKYEGDMEYETIAAIKSEINIFTIANGDIYSPEKAKDVLEKTNADAVMLGCIAQGWSWVFLRVRILFKNG